MFIRPRVLSIAALIVLALSACGSDGEEIRADAPTTTVVADDAPSTTQTPTTSLPDGPLGAGPYPIATLDIVVTPDDGKAYTYTISCLGDTATIIGDPPGVTGEAACLALATEPARQRLIAGVPADRMCTEIYGSADTATVSGTLDDQAVATDVDRANGCGIDDWDVVLSGILPPATA